MDKKLVAKTGEDTFLVHMMTWALWLQEFNLHVQGQKKILDHWTLQNV